MYIEIKRYKYYISTPNNLPGINNTKPYCLTKPVIHAIKKS
jgi:hypothetical protein